MNELRIFKNHKRGYSRLQAGFTLIELVVVIGIIGMISSLVVLNMGSEQQNSSLLRSAQKLSLNLRQVQAFALSSKKFTTIGVPCGWGIHFNGINSNSYVIFADLATAPNCSDRNYVRDGGSEDFETVNLEADIVISSLSGSLSDVVFTAPEPTVNFIPDQASAGIVLTAKKSGATKTVTINKTGFISSPR